MFCPLLKTKCMKQTNYFLEVQEFTDRVNVLMTCKNEMKVILKGNLQQGSQIFRFVVDYTQIFYFYTHGPKFFISITDKGQ